MLAQAYAEGATACEGFDRQTVYWLAYDILASARSLFENGSPEQQQIDQTIVLGRKPPHLPCRINLLPCLVHPVDVVDIAGNDRKQHHHSAGSVVVSP